MPDQHWTFLNARLTHGARPERFIMNRSMHILAARSRGHQISQVDHYSLRRERLACRGGWTCILTAAALHAGIKAEQLLTIEVRKCMNAGTTCLLDLFNL